MNKKYFNYLSVLLILIFTSCSKHSDTTPPNSPAPVKAAESNSEALKICNVEVDKLDNFIKTGQKEQIKCLQENFVQLTKTIHKNDSTENSDNKFNILIRKFSEDQIQSIIKGLSLIFQKNMLLLKEEADRSSSNGTTPTFNLLVKLNQDAIIITKLMNEASETKNQALFWDLRKEFITALARFSENTISIIKISPQLQSQFNYKNFLIETNTQLGNSEFNTNDIDSLILLKRFLVSGNKEEFSSVELTHFVTKIPKFLTLYFDFNYLDNSIFSTIKEKALFRLKNIRELFNIIEFNQTNFELFSADQIFYLAEGFIKNADIPKFKKTLFNLKKRIIGGELNSFSLSDLKNILDLGQDFLERDYFTSVAYIFYQDLLDKNAPMTYEQRKDLSGQFDNITASKIAELHADFLNTAVTLRYFRSPVEGVPYYGNKIIRSQESFLEVSHIKWLSQKLLKAYGHRDGLGIQQLSPKEFQLLVYDLKDILIEMKLWSPTPETFTKNLVLLADLFQSQSNGDLNLNSIEVTDYILMTLTSLEINDNFLNDLSYICDSGNDNENKEFYTSCFNEYFFQNFLNRYKNFLPKLAEYINPKNTPKEEIDNYLLGIEGFARDNPNVKMTINKRDSVFIIGSLLNIESAFNRYDTNQNNIIDYDELLVVFKTFKQSIISIAKLKLEEEKYALSIFLYMASKMEIPEMGSWMNNTLFYSYHKCASVDFCRNTFMDKIEAKRLNIGKLLSYLVNRKSSTVPDTNKKPR